MRINRRCFAFALGALVLSAATGSHGADETTEVAHRRTDIISEGVRITAQLYVRKDLDGKELPTVIMSHGWGGTAAMLEPQATAIARAGYFVIAFDYRGWGESDARVILTSRPPVNPPKQRFTAEVQEVREVVDPLEQAEDIFNVIHWAVGETTVDRSRIGLWGTSFSGGLVVYVAARDPRIKALVSQVGYMGQALIDMPEGALIGATAAGSKRAHGEIGYPPPRARMVGNLQGGPIAEKFLRYAPIEDAGKLKNCASLFIAAANEELFRNHDHAQLASQRAPEPKRYVVLPDISHYGVYGDSREDATKLAIGWFDQHLKSSAN